MVKPRLLIMGVQDARGNPEQLVSAGTVLNEEGKITSDITRSHGTTMSKASVIARHPDTTILCGPRNTGADYVQYDECYCRTCNKSLGYTLTQQIGYTKCTNRERRSHHSDSIRSLPELPGCATRVVKVRS